MTTTSIITAQSIGTSTNVGPLIGPVKTTLQAATTAIIISVQLTLGATGGNSAGSMLKVWHAVSPISYSTATIGALALAQGAEYVLVKLDALASLVIERSSDVLVTAAGYHYCWIEAPVLVQAATVTVNLQEIP